MQTRHNLSANRVLFSRHETHNRDRTRDFTFTLTTTRAQEPVKTIAERLGYPRDAKLSDRPCRRSGHGSLGQRRHDEGARDRSWLIRQHHGSVSVAFGNRGVRARESEADLGLHLTLTSEWTNFRWGPVLSKNRVSSLLDKDGYFISPRPKPRHMPIESKSRSRSWPRSEARALGIQPTHLDSHMGTLYQSKELFEVFLRVARSQKLPVRVAQLVVYSQQTFCPRR